MAVFLNIFYSKLIEIKYHTLIKVVLDRTYFIQYFRYLISCFIKVSTNHPIQAWPCATICLNFHTSLSSILKTSWPILRKELFMSAYFAFTLMPMNDSRKGTEDQYYDFQARAWKYMHLPAFTLQENVAKRTLTKGDVLNLFKVIWRCTLYISKMKSGFIPIKNFTYKLERFANIHGLQCIRNLIMFIIWHKPCRYVPGSLFALLAHFLKLFSHGPLIVIAIHAHHEGYHVIFHMYVIGFALGW